MTDEQKELFEKYTNCVREYQTITDCLIFQNSFKLGGQNDVGSHGRITEHIAVAHRSAMIGGLCIVVV